MTIGELDQLLHARFDISRDDLSPHSNHFRPCGPEPQH